MRTESFDMPYGPMASAFRLLWTRFAFAALLCLAGLATWHAGNFWQDRYRITSSQLASISYSPSGGILYSGGAAGPYRRGAGLVGVVGGGVRFINGRKQEVDWPAVAGSYYACQSFINRNDDVFVVVRRIPEQMR